MRLTSRGELALKAVLELSKAHAQGDADLSAFEMARRLAASQKFLEQVLAQLKAGGYITSRLGARGGYRLARDPADIFVGEVSRLIDGPLAPAPCASVSQHRTCDWCTDEAACVLKSVWAEVRDAVAGVMDSVSFAQLAARAQTSAEALGHYRI